MPRLSADPAEKMKVVQLLKILNFLQIPADLTVINEDDELTITQRLLVAIMVDPCKMEQVYKAKNTKEALDICSNPVYKKGTREFSGRKKGWRRFKGLIMDGHPGLSFRDALQEWSNILERECSLSPETLTDIPSYAEYSDRVVSVHRRYKGLDGYSILQPLRCGLWHILVSCIATSRHLRVSALKSCMADVFDNMGPYSEMTIVAWEEKYEINVALGPIYTCLTGKITIDSITRPGVMEFITEKRKQFIIDIGRPPSMSMFI